MKHLIGIALAFLLGAAPLKAAEAIFASGCFWCTESDFEKVKGVTKAESGYTGGFKENPTYKQVTADITGHYEAVRITYDPDVVSYQELLDVYWRNVDPFDPTGDLSRYGSDAPALSELLRSRADYDRRLHPALPYRAGEVVWSVRHEMARTVDDWLSRRSRTTFLRLSSCRDRSGHRAPTAE